MIPKGRGFYINTPMPQAYNLYSASTFSNVPLPWVIPFTISLVARALYTPFLAYVEIVCLFWLKLMHGNQRRYVIRYAMAQNPARTAAAERFQAEVIFLPSRAASLATDSFRVIAFFFEWKMRVNHDHLETLDRNKYWSVLMFPSRRTLRWYSHQS